MRASSASAFKLAGMSVNSPLGPLRAFIVIRSITPSKLACAPIGSCNGTNVPPNVLPKVSNARWKLACSRSILLMSTKRGRLRSLAVSPGQFGADFNARDAIDEDHSRFHHADSAFDFTGKIGVARRVQHIDLAALVLERQQRSGERNVTTDFFVVKVRNGRAVFDSDPGA